jgi:hypothetical protein
MNRALWVLGELVLGVMLAGALTAVAVPALIERGWDAGPVAGVAAVGLGTVLCVVIGERWRKARRRDRLS